MTVPGVVEVFADPGLETMPAETQAVVREAEEAFAAFRLSPGGENARRWSAAKVALRDERRRWRQIGEMLGLRNGGGATIQEERQ